LVQEHVQNQNVDEGLQPTLPKETRLPALARNISFSNIHGTVTTYLERVGNENIKIDGGDLSKAATAITYAHGATEKAVQRRS
jgi:hypothetical protein